MEVFTEALHVSHGVSKFTVQVNDEEEHDRSIPMSFLYLFSSLSSEALNSSTGMLM